MGARRPRPPAGANDTLSLRLELRLEERDTFGVEVGHAEAKTANVTTSRDTYWDSWPRSGGACSRVRGIRGCSRGSKARAADGPSARRWTRVRCCCCPRQTRRSPQGSGAATLQRDERCEFGRWGGGGVRAACRGGAYLWRRCRPAGGAGARARGRGPG